MFTTARWCGLRTGGRIQPSLERFSTRQTSHPAETGSFCRRNPFIAVGNTKSKSLSCAGGQPWLAQFSRILRRGQSGSSQASSTGLCTTGDVSPLSTAGPATTTSMTMTLSPRRAARMNLCGHRVSNCPVYARARRGEVVVRRWLSHAMSRAHSASGQHPSSTISTSRTASRTTGLEGNKCLTFWRWRTTSVSGVSRLSRTHSASDLQQRQVRSLSA